MVLQSTKKTFTIKCRADKDACKGSLSALFSNDKKPPCKAICTAFYDTGAASR